MIQPPVRATTQQLEFGYGRTRVGNSACSAPPPRAHAPECGSTSLRSCLHQGTPWIFSPQACLRVSKRGQIRIVGIQRPDRTIFWRVSRQCRLVGDSESRKDVVSCVLKAEASTYGSTFIEALRGYR